MRAVALLVLVLATFGAGWWLSAACDERAHEAETTVALQHELAWRRDVLLSAGEYKAQLEQMRSMLAAVQRRLPDRFDAAAVEQQVNANAAAAHVALASMQMQREQTKEFYAARRIDMTVTGTVAGVAAFVSAQAHADLLAQLRTLALTPAGDGGVRADLGFDYYRYVPE